jgi:hypothetical protein
MPVLPHLERRLGVRQDPGARKKARGCLAITHGLRERDHEARSQEAKRRSQVAEEPRIRESVGVSAGHTARRRRGIHPGTRIGESIAQRSRRSAELPPLAFSIHPPSIPNRGRKTRTRRRIETPWLLGSSASWLLLKVAGRQQISGSRIVIRVAGRPRLAECQVSMSLRCPMSRCGRCSRVRIKTAFLSKQC